MLKPRLLFLTAFIFCICLNTYAQQETSFHFGKISVSDFQIKAPEFEPGANAVILEDVGKTDYIGNDTRFFTIVYTRYIQVRILNKNGFDAANQIIPLYNNRLGVFEKISSIQGSTYNLENGVIHETKLEPQSVFTTKRSKYYDEAKISMPALSAGSIFELTYTIQSNFFSDPPSWTFQGSYPCLWSEYQVTIPSFFHYLKQITGDGHYDIETVKEFQQAFGVAGTRVFSDSKKYRWVKKNVPPFKTQDYLSSEKNYIPRISFRLNYFQVRENDDRVMELGTWLTMSQKLMESAEFGRDLNGANGWMEDTVKKIVHQLKTRDEEIKSLYNYVRSNFTCTNYNDYFVQTSLKDVFRKKSGNVGELNLLLVAMLRQRGITADPAILSTRDNGIAALDFPLLYQYNYLICVVQLNDRMLYLDASQPNNPYNNLPANCYNWGARAISDKFPYFVVLSPDSITENKITLALFENDDKGNFSGRLTTTYGTNESFEIREKIRQSSQKDFLKNYYSTSEIISVANPVFDSLTKPDFPLVLHCDIETKNLKDIIYFNPVFGNSLTKNPFTDADRIYPVEMPAKIDHVYLLNMAVPLGYKVDEIPKSTRVSYNGNDGLFEYIIEQNGNNIQMQVHLKFNKATFSSDEYASLREFYTYVVNKENEQIVLKKIQ